MIYTNTITLIVPLDQLETAKRVSRALDPDVGGYNAFESRVAKDGIEYAAYSSPCTASFAASAAMLLALPEELFAVVEADYATRWTDFVCPTLAEIELFSAAVLCFVDAAPEGFEAVVQQEAANEIQ